MPKRIVKVEIGLEEYFSKYGFGDGDDGAAVDYGYGLREQAIKILDEEMAKLKLPIKAETYDTMSCHNQCQIILVGPEDPSGKYWNIDWDPREAKPSDVFGSSPVPQVLVARWEDVVKAFSRACKRFDKEA
jgi:hypothetical protein